MPRLTALKNNSKGIETLRKMIGGSSPHHWMTETLMSMDSNEKDLPWKRLLLAYEEDVLILAMHKDSNLRYHGCSILIYSKNENCRRHLWEMFRDSERAVRILMIRKFQSEDRHRLYNTLFKIYLNDPVPEVRESAFTRITKDFSDLYSINPTALSMEEKIHCLELLNIKSSHDHDLALQLLTDPQPGVVLAAGLYLEKTGTLDSLIQKARLKDHEDIDRRIRLLQTVADHQLISFLEKKENLNNAGSLFTALSLYESGTHSNLFAWTLEQIFNLNDSKAVYLEMKHRALQCLTRQKDPDSLFLIRELLKSQKSEIHSYLLEHLPGEGGIIYYPVLKGFIQDINFPNIDSLYKAFKSIPVNLCLSDLYSLTRNVELNIEIRRRALIILSSFCEYSCTLFMLENLDLLKKDEMKDLAESVLSWNRKAFDRDVSLIFSQPDAALHQSLMELLASAADINYIPEIEEKLLSPQAITRITALHSLQELNSIGSIEKMKGLFYDSEISVKAHTAAVFIDWDKEECFNEIQLLLKDNLELPEIHDIILKAAEKSDNRKLIPIIAGLFSKDGIPEDQLINTLKIKKSSEDIRILTTLYGDSDEYTKECLQFLFKSMGEVAEQILLSLLSDDVSSSDIKEILEKTGFVERMIGNLKSPFPGKRREAADALCRISTQNACRGLLSAARDISLDIRKMALKALFQAQEDKGMLSLLKEDPDKKIKRLAQWTVSKIEKAGTL